MPQRLITSFSFILAFCGLLPLIYGQEAVVQPERAELQKLEQADKLFENGRDNEAGQLLGQLLESCKDGSFYTDANAEMPQTVPFRNYLVDKLSKLPKTARESYSFQFETQAKRLLDDAVENASLDAVSDIARKYTPTRAGADAALTVALMQFENGDNQAAKLNLLRLKNNTAATPEIIRHVDEYLKRIEDRQKNTAAIKISEADYLDIIGWRLPEGLPNQNPVTNITPPILDCRWNTPIIKPNYERGLLSLQKSVQRSSDIYLQAPMPIIAGGKLITRCFDDITAIDIQTGKRLWSVTEPQHYVKHPHWIAPHTPVWKNSEMQHNILRLELWHNRIAQQLSSNGNLFFSIDGHRAMPMRGRGNAKIVLAGKFYEDRRNEPGNTLTARNIQTGEIVWQAGHFPLIQKYFDECVADADNTMEAQKKQTDEQPDNEKNKNTPKENQTQEIEPNYTSEEKSFLETWFLGTPLPIGNRLFVIAETNSLIQLFVLESQNGKLLRQIPLAQASQPIESALLRRLYPLTPSASGGLILCPTGTGLTVALDATSLEPIWCFRYGTETKDTPNERMNRNQIQALAMSGNHMIDQFYRQSFAASGWQIPSIMIDGDSAVAAPPDQANLYCLDLLTGKKRWQKNIGRQQALYTACIRNGNVFIVTPNELTVFDLQTGKETKKITFPLVLRPCGTGIPGGNQYFIPFTGGYLAQVDLQNGTIHWQQTSGQSLPAARQVLANAADGDGTDNPFGEPEIPAVFFNADDNFGNLVGVQDCVFSLSPSAVTCFDQKIPLAKHAEAALKSNPNDAAGLLQYGRVLKDDGKLSDAVAAFRQSMKIQNTADAADQLRRCLLEAVRKDYTTWNSSADELLALAELPEETAAILYAGKVEYSKTFKIEKPEPAKRYFVKLNDWYGATAQVVVNSKPACFVISAPWMVDVTDFVKQGGNEISVIVYGTPKNLLGPHHNGKQRGSAWPGNFHRAPEHQPSGTAYDTIGYGLFEDFELVE
ncbi:hypothetical protein FACS1894170_00660 [Planctomycetales bacterium]|nr:hypothetical protein FACS1894170_00660 [Planctomycetales bacterium]